MAILSTSGNYVFNQTGIDLITTAFQICQVINDEETPTGAQLQAGLDALNLVAKSLQATGAHLWLQEDAILFLQPGQPTYQLGAGSPDHACVFSALTQTTASAALIGASTITVAAIGNIQSGDNIGVVTALGSLFWTTVNGAPAGTVVTLAAVLPAAVAAGAVVVDYTVGLARPLKVMGGRSFVYATANETPLIPLSRLDYANLAPKTGTGPIANFFFDPQTGQSAYQQLTALFNVFPAPLDETLAVRFTAQRPIQDFSTLANLPDFPAEWLAALKWILALELAPQYGVPTDLFQMIQPMAASKLQALQAWDQELQGTTTFPFTQPVYQVIARALRLCNAVEPQTVPSYGLVMDAFTSLNALVQTWQAMAIHLWCEEEAILFPQKGQVLYSLGSSSIDHATLWDTLAQTTLSVTALATATTVTVTNVTGFAAGNQIGIQLDVGTNFWTTIVGTPAGNVVTLAAPLPSQASANANQVCWSYATALIRPLRVYTMRRYIYASGIENPMIMLSRTDYQNLPNKYSPGTITQGFFDPQLGLAQLNLWPSPGDYNSGFRFTAQRPLTTFVNLNSIQDFPAEWSDALAYNLAINLWPEYAPAVQMPVGGSSGATTPNPYASLAKGQAFQMLQSIAAQKLQIAQGWDREPEGVRFGVAFEPGYRVGI